MQLALPLEPAEAPALREMTPWELLIADYGSTKVTLDEHPLELMRPGPAGGRPLEPRARARPATATRVQVAGLVVARQRPATAKGVTFMLLEDEHGTINLIVPPPVHDRFRLAVRAEPLVLAEGKLERREGVTNIVVDRIRRLERPDLPVADVRHIEPPRTWSSEAGRRAARGRAGSALLRPSRSVGERLSNEQRQRDPRRHLELGRPRLRRGLVPARHARARPARAGTRSASRRSR